MDLIDKKLLVALSENGRAQFSELAKHLRISKQVVQYRMKRLEEQKIIRGYITIINPSALGFMVFNKHVRFHTFEQKKVGEYVSRLLRSPEVTWVANTSGTYEMVYAIYARTPYSFAVMNRTLLENYVSTLQESTALISVQERPFSAQYILGGRRTKTTIETVSKEIKHTAIDGYEKKLLELLSTNARMTLVELANHLKISVDKVRTRLKRLKETGVIQGFTADIDPIALGYGEHMVLMNILGNKKKEKAFMTYLREHPNVIYEVQCVGEWNLTITLVAKDMREFDNFLQDLKSQFSDIISRYKTQVILDTLKYLHLPPLD